MMALGKFSIFLPRLPGTFAMKPKSLQFGYTLDRLGLSSRSLHTYEKNRLGKELTKHRLEVLKTMTAAIRGQSWYNSSSLLSSPYKESKKSRYNFDAARLVRAWTRPWNSYDDFLTTLTDQERTE